MPNTHDTPEQKISETFYYVSEIDYAPKAIALFKI
jgi:hypothetical protein